MHLIVQCQGAVEVAPEGLLHHHPGERASFARPAASVLGEGLGHQAEDARDGGEVVEAVAVGAVDLVGLVEVGLQLVEGVRVVVLAGDVPEPLGEVPPLGPAVRSGLGDMAAELLVGPRRAGHADDREPGVENTPVGQPGQGRQDLARR